MVTLYQAMPRLLLSADDKRMPDGALMNSNFIPLAKIEDQLVVSKILDEWFSKKVGLFLYFGGGGKKCRLSRCISPSLHLGGERTISNGDEFYVSEDSPAHPILKFIPDLPLSPHLKVEKGFKISRSIHGEYFNYEYSGTALGYWKVLPTVVSHFNNGNYTLKDKNSFQIKNNTPGAVFVYSVYDEDYLIFEEECIVSFLDFYIDIKELEFFITYPTDKKDSGSSNEAKDQTRMRFETEKYNHALYLIMQELVVKSDGVPIISKFKPDYDNMWGANVSESTLIEWFSKPEPFTEKRQRLTAEKRKGLYLFLSLFCKKKNIANTKGKPSAVALELNKLVAVELGCSGVKFTDADIKPWLEEPVS